MIKLEEQGDEEEIKYILTENFKKIDTVILYQIKSIKDFSDVKAGDTGGWIQGEWNLGHYGNAWIYDNAMVYNNAIVRDNATIHNNAIVFEKAKIGDNAIVQDNAKVYGYAQVYHNAIIKGNGLVFANMWIFGWAVVDEYIKLWRHCNFSSKKRYYKQK